MLYIIFYTFSFNNKNLNESKNGMIQVIYKIHTMPPVKHFIDGNLDYFMCCTY